MKTKKIYTILLALAFGLVTSYSAQAQTFTTIATDVSGDGDFPGLLDGTQLEYFYDATTDSITFRVTVTNFSANQQAVGVNVMVNIPNGGQTFNFWGWDNGAAYHRLMTTWVTGTPPNYSGTIGIADNAGINANNYTNLSANNIKISLGGANQILLQVKRSDLIPDSFFGTSNTITCVCAAAVGSNTSWNDDIYSPSGTITINKGFPTSVLDMTKQNNLPLRIYPNPAAGQVTISADKHLKNANVKVMNQYGQVVQEVSNVSGQNYSLETSSFSAGFYIIKVLNADVSYSNQFTIKK